MSNKKMGRPTNDPKTITYKLRISNSDNEKLDFCCKKLGKSKADILRMGLEKVYQELKNK